MDVFVTERTPEPESFVGLLALQAEAEVERAATWTVEARVERFVRIQEQDGMTVRVTWNAERSEAVCEVIKSDGFSQSRPTITQGQPIRW
jgi:hypothetical protein